MACFADTYKVIGAKTLFHTDGSIVEMLCSLVGGRGRTMLRMQLIPHRCSIKTSVVCCFQSAKPTCYGAALWTSFTVFIKFSPTKDAHFDGQPEKVTVM